MRNARPDSHEDSICRLAGVPWRRIASFFNPSGHAILSGCPESLRDSAKSVAARRISAFCLTISSSSSNHDRLVVRRADRRLTASRLPTTGHRWCQSPRPSLRCSRRISGKSLMSYSDRYPSLQRHRRSQLLALLPRPVPVRVLCPQARQEWRTAHLHHPGSWRRSDERDDAADHDSV